MFDAEARPGSGDRRQVATVRCSRMTLHAERPTVAGFPETRSCASASPYRAATRRSQNRGRLAGSAGRSRSRQGRRSRTGRFALLPLLLLPAQRRIARRPASDLENVPSFVSRLSTMLGLATIDVVRDSSVDDLVPQFEVVLVRCSACGHAPHPLKNSSLSSIQLVRTGCKFPTVGSILALLLWRNRAPATWQPNAIHLSPSLCS